MCASVLQAVMNENISEKCLHKCKKSFVIVLEVAQFAPNLFIGHKQQSDHLYLRDV